MAEAGPGAAGSCSPILGPASRPPPELPGQVSSTPPRPCPRLYEVTWLGPGPPGASQSCREISASECRDPLTPAQPCPPPGSPQLHAAGLGLSGTVGPVPTHPQKSQGSACRRRLAAGRLAHPQGTLFTCWSLQLLPEHGGPAPEEAALQVRGHCPGGSWFGRCALRCRGEGRGGAGQTHPRASLQRPESTSRN